MSLHGAALLAMGGIVAGAFIATIAKETGITKKVEDKAKETYDKFQQWKAEKAAEKETPVTTFDTANGRIIRRDLGEAQWDIAKPFVLEVSLDHNESFVKIGWTETDIFTNRDFAILEMRTNRLLEYLESIPMGDKYTLADFVDTTEVHGTWTAEQRGRKYLRWTTDIYFTVPCCAGRCTSASAMTAVDKFVELMK